MSRSRRKHPCCGATTAESDKKDKQRANRKTRCWNRSLLRIYEDDTVLADRREITSQWDMAKDGKIWFRPRGDLLRIMRK